VAGPEQGEVFSIRLLAFPFPPPHAARRELRDAEHLAGSAPLEGAELGGLQQSVWPWVLPREQTLSFPHRFAVLAERREPGCLAPGLAGSHALAAFSAAAELESPAELRIRGFPQVRGAGATLEVGKARAELSAWRVGVSRHPAGTLGRGTRWGSGACGATGAEQSQRDVTLGEEGTGSAGSVRGLPGE